MRPLALTMGEPAGIGPDVTIKAWLARIENSVPPFYWIGMPEVLKGRAMEMEADLDLALINHPSEAASAFPQSLPVLVNDAHSMNTVAGIPAAANANDVISSIKRAVADVQAGMASALVTNPIHKATLYSAGFSHPGHTEYLAELAGGAVTPVMMLAVPGLRVVPVTIHTPLAQVSASLSVEKIIETAQITADWLKDQLGLDHPRLAVAGLNPHAGEAGTLGTEEQDIITPAVEALQRGGIDVSGPFPADTLFHENARQQYDAVLCMYHDQALIPLKTLNFYEGINITMGLPFIRTSPDHGTAFDIAGTGKADPRSLIAALKMASRIARCNAFEAA